MHLDVGALRDFYYRTPLGRFAQSTIRDQITIFWPEAKGLTVVGYGFGAPLLRPFLDSARRVLALMPGPQGVMPWPHRGPNVSVLCEETRWPLETGHVDRLVLMHALETSERPLDVLDECYRVLSPGGEVVFVLPNRTGLWARSDATPFGFGRPYSLGQLETLLKSHDFLPQVSVSVLYGPPSSRRFWVKSAGFWERTGRAIPGILVGGVMMVVATKRYPPQRKGLSEKALVLNPLDVLAPAPGKARPI